MGAIGHDGLPKTFMSNPCNPRIVPYMAKKNFAEVIKLKVLKGDYQDRRIIQVSTMQSQGLYKRMSDLNK